MSGMTMEEFRAAIESSSELAGRVRVYKVEIEEQNRQDLGGLCSCGRL